MRAAYYEDFGGPENLQIGERPDPTPDADHLLVRTEAAGVGIWDVGIMRGGVGRVSPPRIPGFEVAGTVEVGAGAFSPGDRVFGSLWGSDGGGFAERAALKLDRAAAMPERLDFPQAAALIISAGTAYEGLVDRARLQPGETVLVTAASGGVGSAALQIAKDVGARVVAVASTRNHDYVRDLGADEAVDYHDAGFVEQLRRAHPSGFDVLFDGTGNEVRDQAIGLVRTGGRAVLITRGTPPASDDIEVHHFGATVNATRLSAIAELVARGKLRMPIEAEFPLERARAAMEHVAAMHTRGRVVLRM
jgi:NADPH:quinone reductase-like Zn-dependent oxidoreductase